MYKNFSNYEIFADGRIWSKVRKKWKKPSKKSDGYMKICLKDDDGKQHTPNVHTVIFLAVNGLHKLPKGYEINHIDEDKTNNAIWNLELVTRKENINWGTGNERRSKALKGKIPAANPPKRVGAYDKNGELVMVFPSTAEAGRQGYNQGSVCACCNGKRKTHKGYEWRYLDE